MLFKKKEIALLQLQIKDQELLFDRSMKEEEDFAKTKMLFNELKKMIERLDELKSNGILEKHWKPPIVRLTDAPLKSRVNTRLLF